MDVLCLNLLKAMVKTSIEAWIICGVRFTNSCATKIPKEFAPYMCLSDIVLSDTFG